MKDAKQPKYHQVIPTSGPIREKLQEKGQFWTPDWVAEAMASFIITSETQEIFDPAVGAGAFFRAARLISNIRGQSLRLAGREIDPSVLLHAQETGLSPNDLSHVELRDFVLDPPQIKFAAIIGNPPYIRHHRLTAETKRILRDFGTHLLGKSLDGRVGLHVYFLLRALTLLAPKGRLAFILPADVCEGISAKPLWKWITEHYRLEAVVTFAPEATPFPSVDTNALIFLISHKPPLSEFCHLKCLQANSPDLRNWVEGRESPTVLAITRTLTEALQTGLSRPPRLDYDITEPIGPVLGDFARVMRGIATGDNEFFFLTQTQVCEIGIPEEFLKRAIGRTRDVTSDVITTQDIKNINEKDRPTFLLSLDGRHIESFPRSLQDYLKKGEEQGLPHRSLIGTRNPWYKMEQRHPPPFLFAYLGRRSTRFIRNEAKILPLTSFLCVYPKQNDDESLRKLWTLLQDTKTIANLSRIGKSYGAGAIKVEPRALEQLPLPIHLVTELGLFVPKLVLEKPPEPYTLYFNF